jgi:hypothetical protein
MIVKGAVFIVNSVITMIHLALMHISFLCMFRLLAATFLYVGESLMAIFNIWYFKSKLRV